MLDRLLDLLLIAVLRTWFARPEAEAPGLVPRLRGPGRRPRPASSTTTPRASGRSRSWPRRRRLPRRARPPLQRPRGQPPMAFLTGWRIALAPTSCSSQRDRRLGRGRGRLRQPLRAPPRSNDCAGNEPEAVPRRHAGMRDERAARRGHAGGNATSRLALVAALTLAALLAVRADAAPRCFGGRRSATRNTAA